MDAELKRGFRLGAYRVLPLSGEVSGPDGHHHVEPKAIDVLLCLAQARGEVVEREEIVRRVWGKVVVGDESITRCISELRRVLHDERTKPQYIQTLSKRGYRLLCEAKGLDPENAPRSSVDVSMPVPGFDGRPAIGVLPFENLTRDPDEEYFADGISEDIITGLQRFHTFPVISRHSTFVYKARAADLATVARELGVGYLVVGTVRKSGKRLRLTVNLVDARPHSHWSHSYDLQLGELFALQDEIARSVVAILEPEVQRAERARPVRASARELDVWDLVRKGMWHQNKLTREDAGEAKRLFELALTRDPDSVEALIQMSWWHFWDISTRRGPADGWENMQRLAQRALRLDPHEARALYNIGVALMMQGDAVAARSTVRQSIELNPSHAWSYATLGTTYILTGEPEQSLDSLAVAMRLSPHDFFIFHAYGEVAAAHHMLGDWQSAVVAAEHALRLRSGYWYALMLKTASLARAGRLDEAARSLAALLKRRPTLSLRDIEWLPFVDRKWPAYFADGLRLAGWVPKEDSKKNDKTRANHGHTGASRKRVRQESL